MIGYNPSHLNKNETLLEAFHRVEAYLKANPQYQVYQSSATYQEGTQEYALNTIVVPEGSTVGKGDVVLFSNVYYAVITAVSETTFSVATATNFRGAQGEQGPKGDTGATGAKGETGLAALMYSKNVTLGPYQSFSTDLDGYNRTPQINDMCLYTSTNTDLVINGIIEEIRPDTQQVMVRKKSMLSTQGPRGEQGPKGENGKDGNATLLYSGELSESITTAEIAQVTRPQNRGILVKDILISTATSTFGAMAQVTALPVGVTTVDVNFIGTLQGGSGVSDYNNLDNIPVINQDLTASGFTPVANTYYRHTGTGGGGSVAGTPLAVGDNVADVYFDTSVDVLSLFAGAEGTSENVISFTEISDKILVKYTGGIVIVARVVGEAPVTVYYMSQDAIEAGWTGWNPAFSGSDTFNATVNSIVAGSDNYLSFISKTPFTSGSAYTTGAIYYYNGTEYKAITDETKTPDYNQIENIPVINQDLTASGFTPVANTYYRHTGATTDTFTQGIIYLYDTAYHKLGESGGGGGTTLNKYTFTFELYNATASNRAIVQAIIGNAKSITDVTYSGFSYGNGIASVGKSGSNIYIVTEGIREAGYFTRREHIWGAGNTLKKYNLLSIDTSSGTADVKIDVNQDIPSTGCNLSITYWNETEITG